MRGVTIEAKARGITRATGCEITITREDGRITAFEATDPETSMAFSVPVQYPSAAEAALKRLHENVYAARGILIYFRQDGKCALCQKDLNGVGEKDHIKSRGAHGRDDRMNNLRIVCSLCHRERHGG